MKNSVIAGIVLAAAVAVLTLIMGAAGLHKSPIGFAFVPVAIVLNVGVLIWCLFKTRAEGRGYGGQLAAAMVMAVVASVLIFGFSMLATTVIFPDYIDEAGVAQIEMMESLGASEAELDNARLIQANTTPVKQAMGGVFGTLGTSFIGGLIAAIFIRHKD